MSNGSVLKGYALLVSLLVAGAGATLVTPEQLPLSTSSRWIVDAKGKRVKLACINWSGAAQKDGVVGGLQHQPAALIVNLWAKQGFNCVRIPWSVAMVQHPHNVTNATLLAANPGLSGKNTLEILDAVVDACATVRLMVILDNHMSDPDWCCSETDENGLWYNDRWPESAWIASHTALAHRYAHQPYVVAAELRNELRSAVVGGVRRSPAWGGGSSAATDWRAAALRAASAILTTRPLGLLIIVDSLSYSTDFSGVFHEPIILPVAHRLVYSAHDYSWSQHVSSEASLHALLGRRWGYLVAQGKPYTAPVWVSEWGDWHDGRNFAQGWWPWFQAYLQAADLDWGYWRGDGTESRGTGRTFGAPAGFGVLNVTWNGPAANGTLLRSLQPLQPATQGPGVDRAIVRAVKSAGVHRETAAAGDATLVSRPKRGFVADTRNGTCDDPALLSSTGWYYGYNVDDPYRGDLHCPRGGPQPFVPMHWCLSSLGTPIPEYVDQTWMMGFNEPNNIHSCGAHTSAFTIAKAWREVMRDYPRSILVSPATAGDGRPWFREFFSYCASMYGPSGCNITIMAVHSYTCDAKRMHGYLEAVHSEFHLPIWLTEFACGDHADHQPLERQIAFMKEILPILDASNIVDRYAWMAARQGAADDRGLLVPGKSELTELGRLYNTL